MEVRLILAANYRNVIGNNGTLLWRLPSDLKRFKRLTMFHPVIMGRKTYESLPNHNLPDRELYVCSKNCFGYDSIEGGRCMARDFLRDGSWVNVSNYEPELLVKYIENTTMYQRADCIWVIGGAEIYKLYTPLANKIYLTYVMNDDNGDTKIDNDLFRDFKLTFQGCPLEENGFTYRYLVFERDKQ